MNPERDRDFEQNMMQLVHLLKKILKNIPAQGTFPGPAISGKEGGTSTNIFFLSFFPILPDELEEWEELQDQFLSQESAQDRRGEDWSTELTNSDMEFLRRNGIRF